MQPLSITYLHDDVVDVVVVDDLKVLDAGLRHAPVEVEHVALSVVAPHGRLQKWSEILNSFTVHSSSHRVMQISLV